MTKVYSMNVTVYATAYIKADNFTEAVNKANTLRKVSLELCQDETAEIPISGRSFDDPYLPEISLSPAMSIYGPCDGEVPELAN